MGGTSTPFSFPYPNINIKGTWKNNDGTKMSLCLTFLNHNLEVHGKKARDRNTREKKSFSRRKKMIY
jgi:hypothetical protein